MIMKRNFGGTVSKFKKEETSIFKNITNMESQVKQKWEHPHNQESSDLEGDEMGQQLGINV